MFDLSKFIHRIQLTIESLKSLPNAVIIMYNNSGAASLLIACGQAAR